MMSSSDVPLARNGREISAQHLEGQSATNSSVNLRQIIRSRVSRIVSMA
jgi:hypothetical protein